ncbi:MAG: hypothetical protein J6U54_05570 [Clostridiales bacterium]|nr:hypothetical protein [Clostridiales bacterium]
MARTYKKGDDKSSSPTKKRRSRPALTPEGRENQMIALAVDLAEQQLRDGTASSQVITHYLKLGSTKERLEMEKLKKENDLLIVKKEAIESTKRMEELYSEAINALKTYNGTSNDE